MKGAEEPLPPGGSCLLSSVNLSEYILNPFTKDAKFDFENFNNDIKDITIFMNEILDEGLPLHPLQEQRNSVGVWRQIGIGFMGLGDMLIKMGIKYGSPESIKLCDNIGFYMIDSSIYQSALLAKEYGAYPNYNADAVLISPFFIANTTEDTKGLVKEYGLRNSQLSTCAPTGSLSNMLGITGGIEPIYNISYTRKTESLHGEDTYYKVYTSIVKQYMDINNIKNEEDLPDYFVTAMTLNYKDRINMQSTWQKHIDASISSTVNVPESFTIEDVEKLYMYAWEKDLKGVTIYRDNCRRSGILTNTKSTTEQNEIKSPEFVFDSIEPISRSNLGKTYGVTIDKRNACGKMFITINRDKNGNIVESFVNVGKTGTCKSNIDGINRLLSLALRSGVKVDEIVDQLKGISCAACSRVKAKGEKIDGLSCSDIIGRLLEEEYKDNVIIKEVKPKVKKVKEESKDTIKDVKSEIKNSCPECGEKIAMIEGCISCMSCGWSKCS